MKKALLLFLISIGSILPLYGQYAQDPYISQSSYSYYDSEHESNLYAKLLFIAIVYPFYISNDIYFHTNFSYLTKEEHNLEYKPSFSFDTGLRVNFNNSALEYGISYTVFESTVFNSSYNEIDYWGFHVNYLQNIFSKSLPQKLKFYVGPSVNYVSDFGVGGIVGVNYKLFDRLKFDFRYERTTQTNQLSVGLIFTYNKY